MTGSGFDPYKTTVSPPQETSAIPSQKTKRLGLKRLLRRRPLHLFRLPRVFRPIRLALHRLLAPVAPLAQAPAAPPPVAPVSPATNVPPAQVCGRAQVVPPVAPSAAAVAPTSRPPKKRSKLPLILGILFVLLLLGAGAVVADIFFVLNRCWKRSGGAGRTRGPNQHRSW